MRLHHVAYVTRSVSQKAAELTTLLGFRPAGPTVLDEVQGVRIQFMDMGNGELLELLEPHGAKSPVQRHLDKGGGLYHLCFEVDDLEATLQRPARNRKCRSCARTGASAGDRSSASRIRDERRSRPD